ncbi:Lachesin [Nymphon striatum]|nr:Lachesin [Nymphon striatum]
MSNSIFDEYLPRFVDPVHNVSVMEGQSAILACTVNNLGDYKVDTQTILTVGMNPVTRDTRFKVTQSNRQNWYLHISEVTFEDKGLYMCQVNAKPMRYRNINLEVLVPPKVTESKTSSGVTVKEFKSVSLECHATGYPKPNITWLREDNKILKVDNDDERHLQHPDEKQDQIDGEFLNITRVTRHHMGAYLCIAANSVPPSVSKRIVLEVTFAPKIRVPHQLVGVLQSSDVVLTCEVEAFPLPMTSWQKYDKLIVSDDRYQSTVVRRKMYTTIMQLEIRRLTNEDFGAYKCSATNILGTKQGLIRLYKTETFGEEKQTVKRKHSSSSEYEEGDDDNDDEGGGGGGGGDHIMLFPYKKTLSPNDVYRQVYGVYGKHEKKRVSSAALKMVRFAHLFSFGTYLCKTVSDGN